MDHRTVDRVQRYVSSDRGNVHVPVADVGQRHRAIQGSYVNVPRAYVAYIDVRSSTFQHDIAMELFNMKRAGCRMQSHTRIRGHQDFVINTSGFRVCAFEKMGENSNAPPALAMIDFDFARVQGCRNGHYFARTGLDRDGSVLVDDGNASAPADFEMHFLSGSLSRRQRGQHKDCHDCTGCGPLHNQHLPNARGLCPLAPTHGYSTMAKNDPRP